MRNAVGAGSPSASRLSRVLVVAVAAVLFIGVFLLRLANEDASEAVTLLYALPIALLAVELGVGGASPPPRWHWACSRSGPWHGRPTWTRARSTT